MNFIQYTVDAGASIAAVELGNEMYYGEGAVGARYPSVEDYLAEMTVWASTIRSRFPNLPIVIPVVFEGFFGDRNNRTGTWNAAVATWIQAHGPSNHSFHDAAQESTGTGTGTGTPQARYIVDGLQVHTYFFNGIDANPALDSPTYLCATTAEKGLLWGTVEGQSTMVGRLSGNESDFVRRMLSVPFDGYSNFTSQMSMFDRFRSKLGDHGGAVRPLTSFATEFNMIAYCGPSRLTWSHALWATTYAMLVRTDFALHQRTGSICMP